MDKSNPAFNEHVGLTKREYLAGLAMQAILSNPMFFDHQNDSQFIVNGKFICLQEIAKTSIQQADELLKQLDKK